MLVRSSWKFGLAVFLLGIGIVGCASRKQEPRQVVVPVVDTPVPTVALTTPTPTPPPTPLPTRPVGREDVRVPKGQPLGPVITHFGVARADGRPVTPVATEKGIPTYLSSAGAGFMLVVEAKPGLAGHEVGRRVFAHVANDPTVRPDLEIISNRPLGNGDPRVCDSRRPNIGGIPAAQSFAETQAITDAINDFACRFETHNDNESACTVNEQGDFAFVSPETTQQFCMAVARAWEFPVGETILTVRVRDVKGNPGPPKKLRIRRPVQPPTSRATAMPSPTPVGPKPLPTRPQ